MVVGLDLYGDVARVFICYFICYRYSLNRFYIRSMVLEIKMVLAYLGIFGPLDLLASIPVYIVVFWASFQF